MREELKIKRDFIKQSEIDNRDIYDYSEIEIHNANILSLNDSKTIYYYWQQIRNIKCKIHNTHFSQFIKIKERREDQKYINLDIDDDNDDVRNGCPKCKKIREKFIKNAEMYHDEYDYSKIKVSHRIGTDEKDRIFIDNIICPEHGIFSQRGDSWKIGCPKCAGRNLVEEDIIKKLEKKYATKYDYDQAFISSEFFLKWNSVIDNDNPDNNDEEKLNKLWDICDKKEEIAKNNGEKIKYYVYNIYCNKHKDFFNISIKPHLNGTGCPICAETKGELQTSKILDSLKIYYVRQKTFKDLKHKKLLRFDFYIPQLNACIEYDGEQHFKAILYWGDEQAFKELQYRDKLKNEYCISNNIPLLRLTYKDSDADVKSKIIDFLGIKESFIVKFTDYI